MPIGFNWPILAIGAVVLIAAAVLPVQAQSHIALIHDAQGHAVYVNDPAASAPVERPFAPTGTDPALHKLILQTALSREVDPGLVEAMIQVESGYHARARSPKGALGLMQLMPATAARFGVNDLFDPAQNIRGGVTYLGQLLKRFDRNLSLSLAAYNAGEGAVLRQRGIPPFRETQDYVREVTALYPASGGREKESGGNSRPAFRNDGGAPPRTADNARSSAPIYEYMDTQGVIHFTQ